MKCIEVRGYVEIPDEMSAEDFFRAVNGEEMFLDDSGVEVFRLALEEEG